MHLDNGLTHEIFAETHCPKTREQNPAKSITCYIWVDFVDFDSSGYRKAVGRTGEADILLT